jgi:hypothetical protein
MALFFFGCTAAKEVWQDTKACHMMSKYIENVIGFVAMIFNMLEEINKDNMAKIVMFLWALWWRRNTKCWHDKIPTIFYVIRGARDTLQDWKNAKTQQSSNRQDAAVTVALTWQKPAA